MSHNKLKRLFLPFISCLTYKSLVDRNIIYTFASNNDKKINIMYVAISADIVSSTSLCIEETIALKQRIEELFSVLEKKFPGFWGRLIKGDYIECLLPSVKDGFRIALIIKSCIKSFPIAAPKEKKLFQTYGVRMAMGIGDMRIVNKEQGIMDGDAIYSSGRTLNEMGTPNKNGTFLIETTDKHLKPALQTVGMLTDALLNNTTRRQSEVLYYKLLSKSEQEIADILGVKQSGINQHSTSAKWYCIEAALNYFEQLNFENA